MRIHPRTWMAAALLLTSLLAYVPSYAADAPPSSEPSTPAPSAAPPRVRVTTNMGEFVIELYPERAPITAANYLRYVKEGFYSGTIFHRVIANFVVQGGGHLAENHELKPVHDAIVNESGNGLQNKRGMVGLARGEPAHSGNAQFYINLVDNPDLDPLATRWGYAVFGHIVEGMDVVDRIGVTPTGAVPPFKSDSPLKPVIIEKAVVLDTPAATAPVSAPAPAEKTSNTTILSPR